MIPNKIQQMLPVLKKIGNQMYAYYGGPVYLNGSSLIKENARDIDIRVVLSIEDFNRLYGDFDKFVEEYNSGNFGKTTWNWAEDRLKRCRTLSEQTGENIDFCVWAEPMWNPSFPHIRLDTKDYSQIDVETKQC